MSDIKPIQAEDLHGDRRWLSVHERFVSDAKEKEPDVVFVGDSHVAQLEQSEVFKELFAPLHCFCFGMGGDTTENLLWRLTNGEMDCMKPKVVILLVGTNDRSPPERVLSGIVANVDLIRAKQPTASIIVLKIPPRGQKPNPKRESIAQINAKLSASVSHVPNCHVLDIDPGFVSSDGLISSQDMYDYLHMTNLGYRKAFEVVYVAIQAILNPNEVLGDDKSEKDAS